MEVHCFVSTARAKHSGKHQQQQSEKQLTTYSGCLRTRLTRKKRSYWERVEPLASRLKYASRTCGKESASDHGDGRRLNAERSRIVVVMLSLSPPINFVPTTGCPIVATAVSSERTATTTYSTSPSPSTSRQP